MSIARSSLFGISSLALAAFMANGAACSSPDPMNEASATTGGDGGSSGSGSSSSGSSGNPSSCPQADSMLDVSKAPGAGDGYAKPTLSASCTDTMFVVDSNSIPHYTFIPVTPNPLVAGQSHMEITRTPKEAAATTEIPLLGYIGFAVNGLPLFGPNEAGQPAATAWGDPVYNGIVDPCLGHTAERYHYHSLADKCLAASSLVEKPWMNADPPANEPSPIIGWAADGFPIYGPKECANAECSAVIVMQSGYEKTGDPKTNAWDAYAWKDHPGDDTFLDECNGHHGPDGDYHYHATAGFPYILGCYRGTPNLQGGGMTGGPKSCTSEADCQAAGSCPQGSKGCTCAASPMGMMCAPTCSVSADCPSTPMGQLQCNQGICRP